ncbi:23S rRNA (guanosine(2251)-2'-O)-methyltransferase RlmB [Lyngbya confervoides]|uniref:23S rRNA (Guanosine(2251)-2'-O)-methyltransferase RlmB n=1 Tax=Lyngbya confervoides BDU141951 TaxID=1574623 RepID=A0ABD4T912_9CYAN|nr:23S rRNA (guanosine(2251)-2'-O)-methyltransferase RlmB [Lyngbya confervoides]MCM1985004.1 23S rRNA (guanosine(2251)-2'-O)-methyltransferase RlmB [Lyngbya confervoides BDU141951]
MKPKKQRASSRKGPSSRSDPRTRSPDRPIRQTSSQKRPPRVSTPQQEGSPRPDEDLGQNREDLIFGRHTVIAALKNQRPLNRVWITPSLRQNSELMALLSDYRARGVIIDDVSSTRLNQLTHYGNHQGIVAQVGACAYLDLQGLMTAAMQQKRDPILVAVDGITDPHNLGAIIRSTEALGAQGLVLPQRRSASVGATVAKVAAGALERLPIARVINLNQALDTLKESGYWVYGLTLDATDSIQALPLTGAVVLVIGSEGKGLSRVTQKHCDGVGTIPLLGLTQSLNASVAAGIALYEMVRQRTQKGIQ